MRSNRRVSTGSPRCVLRRSKALLQSGALQLSLFDQRDMASITTPDFPDERLVVCRNPDLAAERSRKREELLAATERDLARIQAAVTRRRAPLRGAAEIALAVGAVINRHKMAKHFDIDISDAAFSFARKTAEIAAEAAIDGIYVVRTNLPAETCDDATTVRSYKSLALVERAFRCLKTVDLQVRPVYHWLADRVRAHVLLCMLAYYLEWHMRQGLAPMLFEDADKQAAESLAHQRRGAGAAFTNCRAETDHQIEPRWFAGTQLPDPARRSRNHRSKHHRHRDNPKLSAHHGHQADPHPAQSIPVARAQFVASSAASSRSIRKAIQQLARFPSGKLGLDAQVNRALVTAVSCLVRKICSDQVKRTQAISSLSASVTSGVPRPSPRSSSRLLGLL